MMGKQIKFRERACRIWCFPTRYRNTFLWLAFILTLFAIWISSAKPFVNRVATATLVFENGQGFQALNASGDLLFARTFKGNILDANGKPMIEVMDVNGDLQQDVVVGVGNGVEGGQLLTFSTGFHWWRGTDGVLIARYGVTGGAIRYLIKSDFEGIGSGIFVVGWDPNPDLKNCERRTSVADLDNVASECIPSSILRFISTSEPEPTPNQGLDWVAMLDDKMNPLWERTFCSRLLSVVNVIVSDEDGDQMMDYMIVKDTAGHVYHLFPDGFWECVKLGDVPVDPAYFGPKWSQE